LARQHRYVIKDKIFDYDFFVNFEDDMVIKGEHVEHFLSLTQTLYQLRLDAPEILPNVSADTMRQRFYGTMTKYQLQRCIPGFIRVEVAVDGFQRHDKLLHAQIPMDYDWKGKDGHLNASICCQVPSSPRLPPSPTSNDLFFWETGIEALGVRQLPNNDWLLLLAGSTEVWYEEPKLIVGDYWAGNDGYFHERPDRTIGQYMSNQGGWMATRRQIVDWNYRWCRGGFLPPFRSPEIPLDGLERQTVEYWSGGIQISGIFGCNLQRVVSLDPDGFSRHLLYHTANNKQKQRNIRYRFSSRTIQEFWGQLNKVRKNAEKAKQRGDRA
jgi:hypothetical protein